MLQYCLLDEINEPTAFLENARDFLFLSSSMSCAACNSPMPLVPCSFSKSPDELIWRCSRCRKYKNIRSDSVLSGQKILLKTFIQLLFCLSITGLPNIAVSQMTGLSATTINDWRIYLHTRVADWLLRNPSSLGGPGVIEEESQPALESVPTEDSTTFSPLPPSALPVTEESVGPIRRRKKTPVEIISHQYETALKEVNNGGIIAVTLKANGVPKINFLQVEIACRTENP